MAGKTHLQTPNRLKQSKIPILDQLSPFQRYARQPRTHSQQASTYYATKP